MKDVLKENKKKAIRYSVEDYAPAKQMYMEYETVSHISRETGISRPSLQNQIDKQWAVERKMAQSELLGKVSEAKKADFAEMAISAVEIIKRAMVDLAKREAPPSVAEAKRATEILEALDRITRLDDGAPTEITAEKPIAIKTLKKRMKIDPFATVEEIEYVEKDKKITD